MTLTVVASLVFAYLGFRWMAKGRLMLTQASAEYQAAIRERLVMEQMLVDPQGYQYERARQQEWM